MSYLTIGILVYTIAAVIFGMIHGIRRGRDRAILRFTLVLISAVSAVFLKETITNLIMDINVGEGTIKETFTSAFSMGETELPEVMQNLIIALIEIIIGLLVFYLIFNVLRFLTWLIIYPMLRPLLKRRRNKYRGVGGIFGFVQGLLIAFIVCAPLNGLLIQVNKLSQVEMNGQTLVAIPEDVGINEYVDSMPSKVYTIAGNWLFEMVTSTTDDGGNKVSINDTCDVVVTVVGIADAVTELGDSMNTMANEESTPQERVDAMQNVGDKLVYIGTNIDSMSEDAKQLVNGLIDSVKDMAGGEGEDSVELDAMLENFNLDNLDLAGAGNALNGIATYIEKTDNEFDNNEQVTQDDVNKIVNGLASNTFLIDMMEDGVGSIIDAKPAHKIMFDIAIRDADLTLEQKNTLKTLLGVTA